METGGQRPEGAKVEAGAKGNLAWSSWDKTMGIVPNISKI